MKKKKNYFVFAFCIFLISTLLFSVYNFAYIQIFSYPTSFIHEIETEEPLFVVVPGSRITKFGVGYALEERLYAAQSIYHNNENVTIFLSGAYYEKEERHEVEAMLDYLRKQDVLAEDIVLDYEGNSTIDTIAHIKTYNPSKQIYICTQEMYIPRTMYLAKKLEVDAVAVQVDQGVYKHDYFMACVREYLACSKAVLQTIFK